MHTLQHPPRLPHAAPLGGGLFSARRWARAALALLSSVALAATAEAASPVDPLSDDALVQSLPGSFENGFADVNGTRLHYVAGGSGSPLFLLPGWPQTWWQFHKVMPALARNHRVIAVDLRGMGGSAKPVGGYDKKTMAADILALARHLGFEKVSIAGHDIGAMVAYSFAANHPAATERIALIDVQHPDAGLYQLTLLPRGEEVGGTGAAMRPVYLWWFALNQVDGLPERLWANRSRLLIDWLFDTQLQNPAAIGEHDRAVYARAYDQPGAIRAGNGWYQAFRQDVEDDKAYGPIAAPLLMLAGDRNHAYLSTVMPAKGPRVTVQRVRGSSHYVPEEQPEQVVAALLAFLR